MLFHSKIGLRNQMCKWSFTFLICVTAILTFSNFAIAKSKILNQLWGDQNFTVNFQHHQNQKQNLTKHNEIEQTPSIILWNFVKFHKIFCNFLYISVKFSKIYTKFCSNDLENKLNICWISFPFGNAMKNEWN